jgi:predicted nucleotidyltransferase component of viral defense system
VIDDVEARTWAERFGVDITQIHRDHLISHVLASLPGVEELADALFIGGTALCRTHLDELRVSEDIDLLVSDVTQSADALVRQLPRLIRRPYPDITLDAPAPAPRGQHIRLSAGSVPSVEIQLIRRQAEDGSLAFAETPVSLRYRGLSPRVDLLVPSAESFVAMKYLAFRDRQAPRDLFDLAHLTIAGAFNQAASNLIRLLSGAHPEPAELRRLPDNTARTWEDQLAHQTVTPMPASDALRIVRNAVMQLQLAS